MSACLFVFGLKCSTTHTHAQSCAHAHAAAVSKESQITEKNCPNSLKEDKCFNLFQLGNCFKATHAHFKHIHVSSAA